MVPAAPSPDTFSDAELARILQWYVDMGVDAAIDATAHDRFADCAGDRARRALPQVVPASVSPESNLPASGGGSPAASPRRVLPPRQPLSGQHPVANPSIGPAAVSNEAVARSAREIANAAATLEALRAALEAFEGCTLKRTATRLVFADANPSAKIMLVGEAPRDEEDRAGVPFVGPAGQLLDKMLAAIGLDRTQVYIADIVPWRPPGNRAATAQEIAICLPFIERQIELVDPQLLVCLGGVSAQSLLGVKDGIVRARGAWYDYSINRTEPPRTLKALATLHPAYLLRTPRAKREAWRDFRALAKALAPT